MFLALIRYLPEGKKAVGHVNTDNIVYSQESGSLSTLMSLADDTEIKWILRLIDGTDMIISKKEWYSYLSLFKVQPGVYDFTKGEDE